LKDNQSIETLSVVSKKFDTICWPIHKPHAAVFIKYSKVTSCQIAEAGCQFQKGNPQLLQTLHHLERNCLSLFHFL